MPRFFKLFCLFAALFMIGQAASAQTNKYKCMVQMSNYMGDGAYVVISLINSKGAYEKTLYVLGSDKKWYNSLKEWHKFYKAKPTNINAITGASVTGGDRSVNVIELEQSKINAGYKIRFESAVEDKKYNVSDVEVPLTTEGLSAKTEGTGYIRHVRFSAN
ncbi:DUF2271 domain-containing protein [Mucilaginibacter aquatilis]|uniref:DUF2271 domain-containing protein n=1 Tax=Mucilaginibacter aquatilis TaxID=1517760 RepID=A0A6I4IEB9_9SPHI|nr:DUF2271 domain-containing protein [Mucilaginibacter aquatilis]MVN91976.1 DUF2271 domain-containing protein [Mucilaginibacter aquatilis]